MKKGSGLAVVLIVIAVLLVFGKLGHLFGAIIGTLISILIPVLVIALGVMAWRRDHKIIGAVLAVIGGFMLLGKLSTIIFWIAIIGLIVFIISMLGSKSSGRR